MFSFFANLFGYVLNFLYNMLNNYGFAIILFTLLIKLLMLPLSIKQQRTMKKTAKLQEKIKIIQFKYKNDPEKMNQEMMNLYKDENMSPFSGCFSTIIQFILLISIFYLVSSPLKYMKKVDTDTINNYINEMKQEGKTISDNYPEIDIIREKGSQDEMVYVNTEFFGLDLSQIPQQNLGNYKVWIIPVLYIVSSFISIKMTTKMQEKENNKKKKDNSIIDITENKEEKDEDDKNELDTVMQTKKTMSWMMPILSISIALIAPLGLALYWLVNNILMIVERLVLDKVIKTEEE